MLRLQNAVRAAFKKSWKEFLVLGLYLTLTLILLCPFSILNMGSTLIGDGRDGYQSLWNLWWVKRSTLNLANPYITDYLYYPYGADLYVHSLSPGTGFLTIPLQLAFGLVFTYNLVVILSFVLAGYGAYCLAHYVTKDKKASFFGGVVFAFSAYHFARALEHMNLVSIQWMPFYVLFLLKMGQEKTFKNIFLAAAFLILTGLTADLQYVFFLGMFTVFFVIYRSISDKAGFAKFLVRLGSMTAVSAGVLLLFLAPTVLGFFSGRYEYAISSPSDSVVLSADLLAFLTPNSQNLFFGGLTGGLISSFLTSPMFPIEGVAYVGYTVLALAIYAAVKLKKTVMFWLFSSLAFIVLSLGPMLHIMGSASFTVFHVNIPLPELVLYYVFPVFRAPSRFIVMAILCLSVISAIAITQANMHIGKLRHGRVFVLLFVTVLSTAFMVESNMLPYPTVEDTSVPEFYSALASMEGNFSVLDLPQTYQANNVYMYYGTVSEKPLVGGSISRSSPENSIVLQAVPLIRQTTNVLSGEDLMKPTDIILQDVNAANLNAFYLFGVKYVVLHRDLMDDASFKTMVAYVDSLMGKPVYTDEKIVAYEAKPRVLNETFTFVASGWWNLEEEGLVPIRWMGGNATVQVYSPSNQYCTLNFTVGTDCPSVVLGVSHNGGWMGNVQLFSREPETVTAQGFFRKGINELSFSANQTFVPAEVNATSSDTRKLSVYLQNLEILPY